MKTNGLKGLDCVFLKSTQICSSLFRMFRIKGTTKLSPQIIFVSDTKINKSTTNTLNCYFSKYIYIFAHQTNHLHIEKQVYCSSTVLSVGLIFCGNPKTSTLQVVWKEMIPKPSKVVSVKSFFSSVNVILQLASLNGFYSMQWLEDIFFYKSLLIHWGFFIRHIFALFKISDLK